MGKISDIITQLSTIVGTERLEVADGTTTKYVTTSTLRSGLVTQATFDAQGASGRLLTDASSDVYQSAINTVATDLTGLTITFTVGSRPVECRLFLPWVTGTEVCGAAAQITDAAGTQKALSGTNFAAAGAPGNILVIEKITTPGTYTRKAQLVRYLGASTARVANNFTPAAATVTSRIGAYEL
jgi:hypothetical protein